MKALFVHFMKGMLHPGSTQGEDVAYEPAIQILGIVLAASWLLPAFSLYGRYMTLQALPDGNLYRTAYSGDALLIAVMVSLVVALTSIAVWPAMFLSRLEYFILTPLPISRKKIVIIKAAAAICFMAGFVVALTSCPCILIPGVASGHWEPRTLGIRVVGYLITLYGTGLFTFLGLLVLQGMTSALLPARVAVRLTSTVRSVVLLAVVCAVPLIQYFPSESAAVRRPSWLLAVPPAWFWGWGEWITGVRDPLASALTHRAFIALLIAIALAGVTYAFAYFRNEFLLSEEPPRRNVDIFAWMERWWPSNAGGGTLGFVVRTLARSRQHATSLLLSCGFGIALVAESFVYLYFRNDLHTTSPLFDRAVITLPITLGFFLMLGLRRAFRIPSELAANWAFRFLETPAGRKEQLGVAYLTIFTGGCAPILASVPLVSRVLGWHAAGAIWFDILNVLMLSEYVLQEWNAVPFTRARNAGNADILRKMVIHLIEFSIYCFLIPELEFNALTRLWIAAILSVVITGVTWKLRSLRMLHWGKSPLDFGERAASVVEPLDLQAAAFLSR